MNAVKSDADHVPCVLIINSSGGNIAGTLDSSYYKGQGEREGIEREYIVVEIVEDELLHRQRTTDATSVTG